MYNEYKEKLKNSRSYELFKNQDFISWVRTNISGSITHDIWANRKEIKYIILNDVREPQKCVICSENIKFSNNRYSYAETCSPKCRGIHIKNSGKAKKRTEKAKQTNLKKYGTDNPFGSKEIQDKIKRTNMEKYGHENVMQSDKIKNNIIKNNTEKHGYGFPFQSDKIQTKAKQTNLERYGHEFAASSKVIQDKIKQTFINRYNTKNALSSNEVQDKIKRTNLERYGVEYPLSAKVIKEKVRQTNLERYGNESPLSSNEIREKIKQTNLERYGSMFHNRTHYSPDYTEIFNEENKKHFTELLYENGTFKFAELVGCDASTIYLYAKKYNIVLPPRPRSKHEQQLIDLFEKYNIKHIYNDRTIVSPLELDFYLPDHNIAIELNGVYWHCEKFKDKVYHYNKWKSCKEKGIDLYSIFEDDFSDMWINKILHLCKVSTYDKIYARKCEIKEIGGKTTKNFLDCNHLQGNKYSSINIGLYHQDELVTVMSFSNTRNNKNGIVELTRFCNKMDTQVMGGASKLLAYFINNYGKYYNEIISFSDNTYSDGGLYKTLGFYLESGLKPDYKYVINNKRIHKTNFRKSKIQDKFDLDPEFVNNHTEKELMDMLRIYRIWDCGKKKWTMKL